MQTVTPLLVNLLLTAFGLDETGIRIRLTRKGLDYASVLGSRVLDEEVKNITIPDVQGDINGGPGKGQVFLKNMQITNFVAPDFSYSMNPPEELVFRSKGGVVQMTADWAAWYKIFWTVKLSGGIKAAAEDIDLSITTSVSRSENGLPLLNVTACRAKIDDLSLRLSGGAIQWFVNLFRHIIAAHIKDTISEKVCEAAQGVLLEWANNELRALPTEIPIYEHFSLHYALSKKPEITENYVESNVNAFITWRGEKDTPVTPTPLPNVTTGANATRMLYMWASDYVLNSFFHSAHTHKAIQFVLNKEVSPKAAVMLKTTCTAICFGKMIPEVGKRYPNKSVDIHIYSDKPPTAEFHENYAVVNATALADFYAEPFTRPNPETLMFRARVIMSGELKLGMREGPRLTGQMTITALNFTLVKSNIGTIKPSELEVIDKVAKGVLQLPINAQLAKGILVPTIEGVRFVRPEIKLLNRTVQIETDISYKKFFPRHIMKQSRSFKI